MFLYFLKRHAEQNTENIGELENYNSSNCKKATKTKKKEIIWNFILNPTIIGLVGKILSFIISL